MIVVGIVMALLNWIVGGLYVSDGRWGFAAIWIVLGYIWLVVIHIASDTRRINREIDRIRQGIR